MRNFIKSSPKAPTTYLPEIIQHCFEEKMAGEMPRERGDESLNFN